MLSSCLGLAKEEVVCVCVGGGGERVVSGWLLENSLLPSRDWAQPWVAGWGRAFLLCTIREKALTQRNVTLSSRGRPTITQHIFTAYWIVQEAGWGRWRRGQTSERIPQCVFGSLSFVTVTGLSFPQNGPFPLLCPSVSLQLRLLVIGAMECVMIWCAYEGHLVTGKGNLKM